MAEIELNVTGASHTSRSKPQSAQVTRNWIPEVQENPATRSPFILQPFPGYRLLGTSSGTVRALKESRGILYKIAGTTLYSVSSDGTHTILDATIPDGSSRIIMEPFQAGVVFVVLGDVYYWDGATMTVNTTIDPPTCLAVLNSRVIYNGANDIWGVSDVGVPLTVDPLNYSTAESAADKLIRVFVFRQTLLLMGARTIEPHFNSDATFPPFTRLDGGIISTGIAGVHAVDSNDTYMYWLSDDNVIYRASGTPTEAEPVSTVAISMAIERMSTTADCEVTCFSVEGRQYAMFSFNSGNVSWCFAETGQLWFEVSSGVDGGRGPFTTYARAFGKSLVGDYRNGNIYHLDTTMHSEHGCVIRRVRDTGPLHSGLLGAPGRDVTLNALKVIMETGTTTGTTAIAVPGASGAGTLMEGGTVTGSVGVDGAPVDVVIDGALTDFNYDTASVEIEFGFGSAGIFGLIPPDNAILWVFAATVGLSNVVVNRTFTFTQVGSAFTDPSFPGGFDVSDFAILADTDSMISNVSFSADSVSFDVGTVQGTGGFTEHDQATFGIEVSPRQVSAPIDPLLMMQLSCDGGRTFGTVNYHSIGDEGQHRHVVEWNNLGTAENFIIRLSATDAAPFSIHSTIAELEVGL